MDPLGARPATVEVGSIARWNTSEPEGPPPNVEDTLLPNAHVISPFTVREDLNAKVALWCVCARIYLHIVVNFSLAAQ